MMTVDNFRKALTGPVNLDPQDLQRSLDSLSRQLTPPSQHQIDLVMMHNIPEADTELYQSRNRIIIQVIDLEMSEVGTAMRKTVGLPKLEPESKI